MIIDYYHYGLLGNIHCFSDIKLHMCHQLVCSMIELFYLLALCYFQWAQFHYMLLCRTLKDNVKLK